MDAILVDTDVFSFFFRQDTRRLAYRNAMQGRTLCLSFASVGELRVGAALDGWGAARRAALEMALEAYVMLGVDSDVTKHWAAIKASRQRAGRPIASEDAWIAATAVRHGMPLITHNAADYADILGLNVVSFNA